MDDIYQILIYVIIAISFISSFFKKKKPVPPPSDKSGIAGTNLDPDGVKNLSYVKDTRTEPDFLKELESFFNVGDQFSPPKKENVQPVHDDKNMYEGAEKRDNYVKVPEKSFHEQTSSEHSFIDPWEIKQKEIEKKKKTIAQDIEKKASLYKKNLELTNTAAKGIVHNIRNRIKDPASLKEYIVISEIIGKPKAYKG